MKSVTLSYEIIWSSQLFCHPWEISQVPVDAFWNLMYCNVHTDSSICWECNTSTLCNCITFIIYNLFTSFFLNSINSCSLGQLLNKTYFEKLRKTIVHKILTLDCGSCLKYMYHHIMFGICVLWERDDQAVKLSKSQPLPPPPHKKKKLN